VLDSTDLPERSIPSQPSQLSALARSFVDLGLGNYIDSSQFIADNPSILAKGEIDALVAEALVAEKAGQPTRAQTYIHQAMLLRQCKEVGPNKISSFFRDLTARDGRTKDSFVKDVIKVYSSIKQQAESRQSQHDPIKLTGSVSAISSDPSSLSGETVMGSRRDGGYAASRTESFHRPAASGPTGPLPTLPEHRTLENTRIQGTADKVDKLDPREYLSIYQPHPIVNKSPNYE
jgi:hypothetical protein